MTKWSSYIKSMAKVHGQDVLPNIKLPRQPKPRKERAKETKPRKHKEKDLQRDIINYLRLNGAVCGKVKAEAGMYMGRRLKSNLLFIGVPDLLCFYSNKMYWIEVKIDTGKLSIEQYKFQQLCQNCNINHIIARSLDDIKIILK